MIAGTAELARLQEEADAHHAETDLMRADVDKRALVLVKWAHDHQAGDSCIENQCTCSMSGWLGLDRGDAPLFS